MRRVVEIGDGGKDIYLADRRDTAQNRQLKTPNVQREAQNIQLKTPYIQLKTANIQLKRRTYSSKRRTDNSNAPNAQTCCCKRTSGRGG